MINCTTTSTLIMPMVGSNINNGTTPATSRVLLSVRMRRYNAYSNGTTTSIVSCTPVCNTRLCHCTVPQYCTMNGTRSARVVPHCTVHTTTCTTNTTTTTTILLYYYTTTIATVLVVHTSSTGSTGSRKYMHYYG